MNVLSLMSNSTIKVVHIFIIIIIIIVIIIIITQFTSRTSNCLVLPFFYCYFLCIYVRHTRVIMPILKMVNFILFMSVH